MFWLNNYYRCTCMFVPRLSFTNAKSLNESEKTQADCRLVCTCVKLSEMKYFMYIYVLSALLYKKITKQKRNKWSGSKAVFTLGAWALVLRHFAQILVWVLRNNGVFTLVPSENGTWAPNVNLAWDFNFCLQRQFLCFWKCHPCSNKLLHRY